MANNFRVIWFRSFCISLFLCQFSAILNPCVAMYSLLQALFRTKIHSAWFLGQRKSYRQKQERVNIWLMKCDS